MYGQIFISTKKGKINSLFSNKKNVIIYSEELGGKGTSEKLEDAVK